MLAVGPVEDFLFSMKRWSNALRGHHSMAGRAAKPCEFSGHIPSVSLREGQSERAAQRMADVLCGQRAQCSLACSTASELWPRPARSRGVAAVCWGGVRV